MHDDCGRIQRAIKLANDADDFLSFTSLEFDLKQFRTETIKAYTDMAYEMTIVKGPGEDSIKRLASMRSELTEFRAEQTERAARLDMRLDNITGQLALILAKLDERKSTHGSHIVPGVS